jgi:hypothetical protein
VGAPDREISSMKMGGMSSLVEESTLSSAELGSFREGLCKAALRRCMC